VAVLVLGFDEFLSHCFKKFVRLKVNELKSL
jgi:hypothetical protein